MLQLRLLLVNLLNRLPAAANFCVRCIALRRYSTIKGVGVSCVEHRTRAVVIVFVFRGISRCLRACQGGVTACTLARRFARVTCACSAEQATALDPPSQNANRRCAWKVSRALPARLTLYALPKLYEYICASKDMYLLSSEVLSHKYTMLTSRKCPNFLDALENTSARLNKS